MLEETMLSILQNVYM